VRTIVVTSLAVLLVLLALTLFVEFFGELKRIGEGSYTALRAFIFVVLRLPDLAIEMLPAATLLGTLLGLGSLAARSELIAMQAAGISRLRLARGVVLAGLMFAALMASVGEYFAPELAAYARQMRAMDRFEDVNLRGGNAWMREGNLIVNMRQSAEDPMDTGIYVYELGPERTLRTLGRAGHASAGEGGSWMLSAYRETRLGRVFSDGVVTADTGARRLETDMLTEDLMNLSAVQPGNLNVAALRRYVRYLRANRLDPTAYEIAYWSRISRLVSVIVMALLALPFVFGSLRAAGGGARLIVGVMIGLAYFLVSRMLANGAVVFQAEPVVMAFAPPAVLGTLALVGLLRVR